MRESVVPYRVLGDSALQKLSDGLRVVIRDWIAQLFGDGRCDYAVEIDVGDSVGHSGTSNSYVAASHASELVRIRLSGNTFPELLSIPAGFREQRGSEAESTLIDSVQRDLLSTLAGKLLERGSFGEWELKRGDAFQCDRPVHVRVKIGEVAEGEPHMFIKVVVPVTSLCPCSKSISDRGAHNQRSHVTVTARTREFVWIEELIELVEKEASCELFGLLKRPDEKFVTERAYDHPKFVEDMVRDVAGRLNADDRIVSYTIESENFESIHNHSAYALIEHDKEQEAV